MSDQSPYQRLGITEDASFDEVQDAKERLLKHHAGDRGQQELIEAAYDAILMERLRMVQQGKIKVPDRIRYAEKLTQVPASFTPVPATQPPAWLRNLIDTPSRSHLIWSAGVYTVLGVASVLFAAATNSAILQLTLAFGIATCLYFLNAKEHKFGRAVLLTLAGLITGLLLGSALGSLIPPAVLQGEVLATLVTLLIFWVISSFLR
ncbi:molecular chaperone DnaJ [Leptolyngbya sp. 'hensonii']|uniref:CPP1-like family protein n=1 Tax=Leptolyngbya sp. 'hensonii' TaxID=1922337 RepID=UPI0009501F57|nr:CPP1-like family protein [Leptolyngbya sp. 'hensonii']OLP18963.1 molecular chaperone DnaJ [Leptolyngbya sp. 'hensonii']